MIPGMVSKVTESRLAAATTIYPQTDLINITDTTATTTIATCVPPFAGFSGVLFLANNSGGNLTLSGGNFETARVVPDNMLVVMVYSKLSGKWFVSAIS